ncbi:hypothetical protein [Ruminococcus sp.]|uniref:hypothetical protein n=1 Tax=Ruminococcus sp. TaxID=41978 RepID=UPI0025EBF9A7|nr:hypothetical protein [Ruminococcus sp.]
MSEPTPTVLRETKIGQKGFIKEDVITYLDELNSKIVALEEENKALKEKGGQADSEEINKYKNQIENLQEKLNTSNNALRAAKKENEELQNTINQLKAQGGGQQVAAALEAAKKEIDSLKEKLKVAEQKAAAGAANPQANAQTTAALEAAKKEIEDLRNRLKAAEQKAATASAAPVAGGAADAELARAKQEIAKISDELTAKTKEISDITSKLEAKTREVADKEAEISKLNDEIVDLKENATPSFDMGALFTEAQKNVTQIQNKAKRDAEAVTKEANDKAAQVIKDANIEAEKAVANANVAAEACIKEANDQARNTVNEANAHADKVNAMSKTVREMLLTEIESINSKFTDIASVLNNLTGQCSGRMNDAQNIISEARKAVDTQKNEGVVKRSEPPRAEFKPSKAPKGDISELPSAKINEVKNDNNADLNKNNNFNNKPAQPTNQANGQNQQNKPAQAANKSASFNFDMAELLKAAEEEAAKDGEN